MRKSGILFAAAILATSLFGACNASRSAESANDDLAQFVDPFIGTGDHGHVFLGANVPFGLVQAGPSEYDHGWDWCSGYHYSDSIILGFSQTHLSGTGIGDLADILFVPSADPSLTAYPFSHDQETASPGYYSIDLSADSAAAVKVELTATERAAMHRYTFANPSDSAYVKIDLNYHVGWESNLRPEIKVVNDSTIVGSRLSKGWAVDHRIYFAAQFSRPFTRESGDSALCLLAFAPSEKPLTVRIGISATGIDGAEKNLAAEMPGWDFDQVAKDARAKWNRNLARITVDADSVKDLRKFYTAMYHAMTAPVVFNDVDGTYRGSDGEIHSAPEGVNTYSILSLWDTYRAAHPLYTLMLPEMQKDFASTFLNIYREQGKLPVWHLHGNETNCMVGNPGIIVMGDLVAKGYVDQPDSAFEAMKASALLDERSLDNLKKYGYLPYDAQEGGETVAMAMEYAIADAAVAKVAKQLGREEDFEYFDKRSKSYSTYFDKDRGFMRAKSKDGKFRDGDFDPFNVSHRTNDYCEGNAWQYIWLVPHDVKGLVSLFGSEEKFIEKLDSLFVVEGDLGEDASPDVSGLIGQYAHGNEPSHHIIYLYNYVGRPDKAAPLLRRVMTELYNDAPAGLCGNEDVGQMSSWYVLSSIGLYQVDPTGGRFIIGSPVMNSATIDLGNGKTFSVVADNNSKDNIYVQSATLNGKPYTKSYIDYPDIMAGGELRLTMGSKPSDFGTALEDRP